MPRKRVPDWVKMTAHAVESRYRQVTWKSRALPDFIIVGAQKSGTSSLHKYLAQHPQIKSAIKKEVHFFDGGLDISIDNFSQGLKWYKPHFPLRRNVDLHTRVFEASPLYLFNPLVPVRMHSLVPDVKIIVLLRNPTERAISHFFHEKKRQRETLSIQSALAAESSRIQPAIEAEDYKNYSYIRCSYKSRGLYREQLERYFQYFRRSQVLVIKSESMFVEPNRELKKIFEFLNVDIDYKVPNVKPRNVANNKNNISQTVYSELNDFFRPHNQALYELMNEDYSW